MWVQELVLGQGLSLQLKENWLGGGPRERNERKEPAYSWECASSRACGLMAGWTDFLCGEGKGQVVEVSNSPKMGTPPGTGALYWLGDIPKLWVIASSE